MGFRVSLDVQGPGFDVRVEAKTVEAKIMEGKLG